MAIFYTDSGSFGDITVSGSAIVSGTLSFTENSGGLTGSLFGTSSWANSASVVDFIGITNKPELVSSSGQISITATNGYSTFSSSIATKNDTQDISINALNAATSSYAINSTIQSQLAGVISSSTQFNALTNTSASFASTASFVNTLTTLTASNVQLDNLTDTTSTNKVLVLNTVTNQVFTTASVGTGGGSVPLGTVSESVSGDAQGQIKLNGVNIDITNLQTNDSPSFTALTTTASSSLAAIYSSSAQVVSAIAGQTIAPSSVTTTTSSSIATVYSSSAQVVAAIGGQTIAPTTVNATALNATATSSIAAIYSSSAQTVAAIAGQTIAPSSITTTNSSSIATVYSSSAQVVSAIAGQTIAPSSITTTNSSSIATVYSSSAQVVSAIAGQTIQPTAITATNITGTGTILLEGIFSSSAQVNLSQATGTAATATSASHALTADKSDNFSPNTVKLTVGTTAPTSPAVNDLWVDTN